MTSTIQGFVARTPSGTRAAAARVQLAAPGMRDSVLATADREGWFAFTQLPPGRYRVSTAGARSEEIALDAYSTVTLELAVPEYATHGEGSIVGKVIDAMTGYPIENASVMIVSGPSAAPDIAPLTNTSGGFSLSGLAAGEWLVRAIAPSGSSATQRVQVFANEVAMSTISISDNADICRCSN
jgi:Carboxypeptidase regulatory-like domain